MKNMSRLLLLVILLNLTTIPLHYLGTGSEKVQSHVVAEAEVMPPKKIITPTPTPTRTVPVRATRHRSVSPKRVRRVTKPLTTGGVWARLRQCESGSDGLYSANTGNGFYGAYQFTRSSWQAVGGSGSPQYASPAEQDARAKKLKALQGWGAWPACSRKLGLR